MEQLGQEELMNFVRDSVLGRLSKRFQIFKHTYHWVVRKIWRGFIRRRSSRRTLPAGDIYSVKVLGHLREHGRLQASIGKTRIAILTGCISS